jgi:tetratricopeptide (TPR) repeat protein
MTDGEARAQADKLMDQGDAAFYQCRNGDAMIAYAEASLFYGAGGNRLGQANALCKLGDLEFRLGNYDVARTAYAGSLLLYKDLGDRQGQAHVLLGLGDVESTLGRDAAACKYYRDAAVEYGLEGCTRDQEDANELAAMLEPSPAGLVERLRALFNEWSQRNMITVLAIMAGTVLFVAGIMAAISITEYHPQFRLPRT